MTSALLAVFACPVSAAVGGGDLINDFRVSVGVAPGYDLPGSRDDTSASARIGASYFTNIFGGWRDWGGIVGGGEFSINPTSDIFTAAFTVFAGWAGKLPANERVHFEGTPFFGIGVSSNDQGASKDTKTYVEFGVRGAAFYTFENRWQLGADIRFLSGQSVGNDWDNRGVVVSAVAGYRF